MKHARVERQRQSLLQLFIKNWFLPILLEPEVIDRRQATRVLVLCVCLHWINWRHAKFVGVQQDDEGRVELRN